MIKFMPTLIQDLGIVGIIFEIVGFLIMLKYYGKPFPRKEYEHWKKNNVKSDEKESKFVYKNFEWDEMGIITAWNHWPIHKKFWYVWLLKTKAPIILIIIGLILQAIQTGWN